MPFVHKLRLPLRLIEARYGAGNFDDAGDAVCDWAASVSGREGVHKVEFDFDTTHPNPWFHVMTCAVTGISDDGIARLVRRLDEEGLMH